MMKHSRHRKRTWLSKAWRWIVAPLFVMSVAVWLGVVGWRSCGRYGERCEESGQFFPGYNTDTRQIDLVMHDLNRNGVIDTWVYRNGQRIEEIEIDRDEDGTIDRLLIPDEYGTLRLADASSGPDIR